MAGLLRCSQLEAGLAENGIVIEDLKHQLAEQIRIVNSLKSLNAITASTAENSQGNFPTANDARGTWSEDLSAAQAKLAEFQKTVETATTQRDEIARQAAVLGAKVNELTQLVREREQALDQRNTEVARDKSCSNMTAIFGS